MKPLMIFDGECGFCRKWIARWRTWTADRVDYLPYQEAAARLPHIDPRHFTHAVHFVETDGTVTSGAKAVYRALGYAPGKRWLGWVYEHVPGFAGVSELLYRMVARHRMAFSWATYLLWGENVDPPTYHLARWAFLRGLGVIYVIAFISAWMQIKGLIGSNGLLPVSRYLTLVRSELGDQAYYLLPSLTWLSSSDFFLNVICASGVAFGLLLIFGLAPAICLLTLWVLYLSIVSIGRDFYSFQWDALLLEAGFLAIFLTPFKLRPRLKNEPLPSGLAVFLLKVLLFKLMFSSGVVKLTSGDAAWRDLTAMYYHYETQPLPTWIGWYAHQLPQWIQKASTVAMFFIELAIPFFIFFPRRLNQIAFVAFAGLEGLIFLTGNYTYFNLLTVALCLFLLDDDVLRSWLPVRVVARFTQNLRPTAEFRAKKFLLYPLALLVLFSDYTHIVELFGESIFLPKTGVALNTALQQFRTFNHYGLFAVMTTERNEIVIEGSNDAKTWLPYEFKWKPGDLKREPGFIEPLQPRLDWQMWFAVFGPANSNSWFLKLIDNLLKGNPDVLALFGKNPFPDKPPRYIRSKIFRYHFSNLEKRRADGVWWTREEIGMYTEPRGL